MRYWHFGLLAVLCLSVIVVPVFATSGELDADHSNLGVPTELNQQSSPNFRVDTIFDELGGEVQSPNLGVMHGFHLLDEAEAVSITITKIVAVPQKRLPPQNNNATYFLLEVYTQGADTTAVAPLWTSASYPAAERLTDQTGVWTGAYNLDLPAGGYDIYLTGLSALRRRLTNQALAAGNVELYFTATQDTAATLSPADLNYPLFAGDAAIAIDPDNSCAGSQTTCPSYTGDEWGDNRVNSLDMAAIQARLLVNVPSRIVKEDLNRDNIVNSLDMSIAQANLLRWGDR
jgi:hypothetical protein